ncbi:SusC/RagA family TonB-linked outer membrane protein [Sphingobacterium sp. LRF_L2]|uniref:SusC/RagA family TonB-linked outer membrane protein n=1 Tax=Sphingobacterium sp. LRF_L2 TaxID=3369421 RepID=UPI003F618ADC
MNSRYKICKLSIALLLTGNIAFGQVSERSLKGQVVDQQGTPIARAILNVEEQSRIATTDKDGNFTLKKVEDTDRIVISCPGYRDTTVTANFNERFLVTLTPETDAYSSVIAVPFGQLQKKFNINAMSTVYGAELIKHPVTVLQNAFTATLTGVQTLETSSEPGWSETAMYIRGIRTMNSSARSPLVIVDDMERDLSFLDAYPIETISILKDAAATSIYGMRGANGVVLVNTKRGKAGRIKIDFSQEFGYQTPSGIPESQNAYNYALTYNQARYLDGLSPAFSDEDIQHYKEVSEGTLAEEYKYKYFNTNWNEVLLRDLSPQNRTNLSISGGNKSARYFVSLSRLHQEGLYDDKWTTWNTGYSSQHTLNRYNLRSNVDIDINKVLNVSLDLGGRIDMIRQPLAGTWTIFTWGTTENLPIYPVFTPTGEWYAPSANSSKNGPALVAQSGIDYNRRRNLYSNATANFNLDFITQGLKAKVMIGFDSYNTFQYTQSQSYDAFDYDFDSGVYSDPSSYTYSRTHTAQSLGDPATNPRQMYYNINTIGSLQYGRSFGKHQVDATAMFRTYKNVVEGYNSSNRYVTFGGIVNYRYDKRYLAQVTASYQGSDNFAPENRWGFFPGASVGWLMSEENWMKNSKFDLLKWRASYGLAGQSSIGTSRYPYQSEYSTGNGYNFGTSQSYLQGVYESKTGNSNITWELSRMLNLGVDYDWKKRTLYGSFDAFQEWRSQILVSPSTVPDLFGAAIPQSSIGKAESKGLEFTLGHARTFGKFNYLIEGSLTWQTNKIVFMDEVSPEESYQARTGQRIDRRQVLVKSQWASDANLISTSAEDALANPEKYPYLAGTRLGNAVYVDQNGDGLIDTKDFVPYGYSSVPELIPNLKLGVGWNGLDFRVILTAYLNRTVETRENMDYGFGWGGTSTHEVTKTWGYYTDDPTDSRNINALYPRLSTSFSDVDRNYPYNTTTVWIRNGNFLALRNVEIGYSLPLKFTSRLHISTCRFYLSGYNLKNWSNFDNGFDPENPTNYQWGYPKTKAFSVGVNIGF